MPSDTDVLYELDLGEPPQQLLDWAKENIHENPDTRCLILEDFRDMIYSRGDCTPHRTDDAFLLRFLRARKFNIESAYRLIVNYYDFKDNNPEIFDGVNLQHLLRVGKADVITVPPYREQTGRRILLYRWGKWDPEKYSIEELFQSTMAILELAILEQRAQILGGIGFMDMSDLTLNQVYHMTPSIAHKIFQIMVTSFPMKIEAVHVVFQPWIFDIVYKMFQPFLTGPMKNRIFLHGEDMDSLHKYIDPKHLPQKYGGRHPDYHYAPWIEGFRTDPKIIKELTSLGYGIGNLDDGHEIEYDGYKSDSEKSEASCPSD